MSLFWTAVKYIYAAQYGTVNALAELLLSKLKQRLKAQILEAVKAG